MNHHDSQQGKDYVEPQTVETDKCVLWPKNTIVVAVKEVAVLLEDSLVRVLLCPITFRTTVRCLF